MGGEGEALSVEGDDGQSQVEGADIAQSVGPQRTVWAFSSEDGFKLLKWKKSCLERALITGGLIEHLLFLECLSAAVNSALAIVSAHHVLYTWVIARRNSESLPSKVFQHNHYSEYLSLRNHNRQRMTLQNQIKDRRACRDCQEKQ